MAWCRARHRLDGGFRGRGAGRRIARLRFVGIPTRTNRRPGEGRGHPAHLVRRASADRSHDRRRRRGRARHPQPDQGAGRRLVAREDRRHRQPAARHHRRRRQAGRSAGTHARSPSRSSPSGWRLPRRPSKRWAPSGCACRRRATASSPTAATAFSTAASVRSPIRRGWRSASGASSGWSKAASSSAAPIRSSSPTQQASTASTAPRSIAAPPVLVVMGFGRRQATVAQELAARWLAFRGGDASIPRRMSPRCMPESR